MRVALVHDYLMQGMRGAERVLAIFHDLYPDAPIYTLLHNPEKMGHATADWDIRTSFLQKIPGARRLHRKLFALMPLAVERLNLREYDLVISSSSAWVKNVRTSPGALHICYCHSPARFLWHWTDEYVHGLPGGPLAHTAVKALLPALRRWDKYGTRRVTEFVANSTIVQQRIRRYFGREATVIHPPVDTERFQPVGEQEDYFLIVSSLNPYKRVDLAIESFNQLRLPLVIIGQGPEYERLKRLAGPTVQLLGWRADEEVSYRMARCRAFVMPQEEDFGIAPLEAQSCGRPVIAYGAGGVLDSIVDGKTGLLFTPQTAEALCQAVRRFEQISFDEQACRRNALRFGVERFKREFSDFVEGVCAQHR